MIKTTLILGTYNSQPQGVCDAEIEKAYQESYKPFLSLLYSYPSISLSLYYSGTLLKWFQDNRPEFLMLLNEMVKRKQVELMGGGYYEPVLPMIPARDRTGQIEKLTTFIRKRFGVRPRGIWLTERVWEPNLPITLNSCGMEYTFLDEKHFLSAGMRGTQLFSPCITEDQGKTLCVLPMDGSMQGLIEDVAPQEIADRIISERPGGVSSLMMDGDGSIMADGKLKGLLDVLMERREDIRVSSPRDVLQNFESMEKVYFPSISHEDMMSWTLKSDQQNEFNGIVKQLAGGNGTPYVSGGVFRQFLAKYPESNLLYSKMMNTHVLVNQVRGDRSRKKTAREELWKGEANFPYWHGKSGGLYRSELRKSAYKALIEAERLTRERGIFKPSTSAEDFDMDGLDEFVYRGYEINAYIHATGGVLFELDYIPKTWNYLDSCSRHPEPYHNNGTGESTTPQPVDWYPRRTFIDHFFRNGESLGRFDLMEYDELGDFVTKRYLLQELNRERHQVNLRAEGTVMQNGEPASVTIEKRYSFMRTAVNVFITVANTSSSKIDLTYGSEINISPDLQTDSKAQIYRVDKNKRRQLGNGRLEALKVPEVVVDDIPNAVNVSISAADEFDLWGMPLETRTLTKHGIASLYQSSTFILRYPLILDQGETWSTRISLRFDRIK